MCSWYRLTYCSKWNRSSRREKWLWSKSLWTCFLKRNNTCLNWKYQYHCDICRYIGRYLSLSLRYPGDLSLSRRFLFWNYVATCIYSQIIIVDYIYYPFRFTEIGEPKYKTWIWKWVGKLNATNKTRFEFKLNFNTSSTSTNWDFDRGSSLLIS